MLEFQEDLVKKKVKADGVDRDLHRSKWNYRTATSYIEKLNGYEGKGAEIDEEVLEQGSLAPGEGGDSIECRPATKKRRVVESTPLDKHEIVVNKLGVFMLAYKGGPPNDRKKSLELDLAVFHEHAGEKCESKKSNKRVIDVYYVLRTVLKCDGFDNVVKTRLLSKLLHQTIDDNYNSSTDFKKWYQKFLLPFEKALVEFDA